VSPRPRLRLVTSTAAETATHASPADGDGEAGEGGAGGGGDGDGCGGDDAATEEPAPSAGLAVPRPPSTHFRVASHGLSLAMQEVKKASHPHETHSPTCRRKSVIDANNAEWRLDEAPASPLYQRRRSQLAAAAGGASSRSPPSSTTSSGSPQPRRPSALTPVHIIPAPNGDAADDSCPSPLVREDLETLRRFTYNGKAPPDVNDPRWRESRAARNSGYV
jgi:hypothetical protein